MSGLIGVLSEAGVRACGVAAIVGAVLFAARVRAGAVRHSAWAAVLCAMLAMPVLPYLVPPVAVSIEVPRAAMETMPPAMEPVARTIEPPPPVIAPVRAEAPEHPIDWAAVALWVYSIGAAGLLARIAVGWFGARRIRQSCRPVEGKVYWSPLIATPLTVGVWGPRVVLPPAWREWNREKLEAVLAHEMAHVNRRDPVFALMARINCSVFWFHPLAWWLERMLAAAAEHACDDCGVRAVGETRKYAGILLDLAEAVRRNGGRWRWQGVGMDGTGLLGERIDRILRGGAVARVSRARKGAVALGCGAAILLAAACRQQTKVAALVDDPKIAENRARNQAEQDFFKAAGEMNAQQANDLEAAVERNPEDLQGRKKLLMFYSRSGAKTIGEQKTIAGRRRQVFWLIEHHPGNELAGSWGARIPSTALDPLPDPAGYAQARKLWLAQVKRSDATAAMLSNAALFFDTADKPLAEEMLLRAQTLDPAGHYSGRLGRLYYTALMGSNASMPLGVVRSVNIKDAHGDFANAVRKKLAESKDPALLTAAGEMLVIRGRDYYERHNIDFDPLPLGKTYLERALELDPQDPRAHEMLIFARRMEDGRYRQPPDAQREAIRNIPESERFLALARMAANTSIRGDIADYYKHDKEAAKASWDLARKDAQEALALAAKYRSHPDYGTAVYKANMVLGMLAMRDGDRKAAVRRMLEAAKAPQTEELAYQYQEYTLDLPRWLLKDGERETVIEFLERFAQVNVTQKQYLLESAALIRAGKKPLWYRN